ncbi:hypothetical protein HY498_03165 [Candidatus Woesearchaeota archaeon]|nr:hypothetical protein [Candidatus Woesearchaeota archaeon]
MEIKNIIQIVSGLIVLALLGILATSYHYIRIVALTTLVGSLFWILALVAIFVIFIGINELRD